MGENPSTTKLKVGLDFVSHTQHDVNWEIDEAQLEVSKESDEDFHKFAARDYATTWLKA